MEPKVKVVMRLAHRFLSRAIHLVMDPGERAFRGRLRAEGKSERWRNSAIVLAV